MAAAGTGSATNLAAAGGGGCGLPKRSARSGSAAGTAAGVPNTGVLAGTGVRATERTPMPRGCCTKFGNDCGGGICETATGVQAATAGVVTAIMLPPRLSVFFGGCCPACQRGELSGRSPCRIAGKPPGVVSCDGVRDLIVAADSGVPAARDGVAMSAWPTQARHVIRGTRSSLHLRSKHSFPSAMMQRICVLPGVSHPPKT